MSLVGDRCLGTLKAHFSRQTAHAYLFTKDRQSAESSQDDRPELRMKSCTQAAHMSASQRGFAIEGGTFRLPISPPLGNFRYAEQLRAEWIFSQPLVATRLQTSGEC